MCALDRRSFIKGVSSGILVGALAPGMNLMAATPPSERRKSASFYPALNFDVIVVGAGPVVFRQRFGQLRREPRSLWSRKTLQSVVLR